MPKWSQIATFEAKDRSFCLQMTSSCVVFFQKCPTKFPSLIYLNVTLVVDRVQLIDFQVLGVAFYTLRNKHSENNSDKRNVEGDKKKQEKYAFLAIENASEKSNTMHMFCRNRNMNIKYSQSRQEKF